jgi:uncharacterized protein
MPTDASSLALFPLKTVLVPGGALALRVFEPRYLDLVRECGRSGDGFGVCLILEGQEAGAVTATAAFGTEARIEDFGAGEDGLLTLRVRGRRRFHVRHTRVRDNGLIVAGIDWREPDPDDELRPEHAVLAQVLAHILEQIGGEHAGASPARLDDAAWVGWRLAEVLPLSDRQRQALLQEDDTHARLEQILALIS